MCGGPLLPPKGHQQATHASTHKKRTCCHPRGTSSPRLLPPKGHQRQDLDLAAGHPGGYSAGRAWAKTQQPSAPGGSSQKGIRSTRGGPSPLALTVLKAHLLTKQTHLAYFLLVTLQGTRLRLETPCPFAALSAQSWSRTRQRLLSL